MLAINAIYDGKYFKPVEPIPVKGQYEVIITFTQPIDTKDKRRERILKHFGAWDDSDVNSINEIIKERVNFLIDRDDI